MPVGRGNTPGVPETPGQEIEVPQLRYIEPEGEYEPTWIAPDGTVLPLNPPGQDFFSLKTVAGLGAIPIDIVTSPSPDGGVIVEFTRVRERAITWPIRFREPTHMKFLPVWRNTIDLFTQTRRLGPGLLRIRRPDGEEREIGAVYQTGLELDANAGGAWIEDTAVVSLMCPDPYWRPVNPTKFEQRQESSGDFLNPFPNIGSGQVLGAAKVLNPGVADVWPEWRVYGPMTVLTATHNGTGRSFTLTYTLAAGRYLTISSRPMRVRLDDGTNLLDKLNLPLGKPWGLPAKSTSDITFAVTGAAAPVGGVRGTGIELTFKPGFETA